MVETLHGVGYDGVVAVEPFDYRPDGPACAARAIGYLRGIEEALGWAR
jgi:D-psicose/D-tagatose/L-ribulose 3-epimerase